jgi:acetolactate synthase small subunit
MVINQIKKIMKHLVLVLYTNRRLIMIEIIIDVSKATPEEMESLKELYSKSINELASSNCTISYRDDQARKMNFFKDLKPTNEDDRKKLEKRYEDG